MSESTVAWRRVAWSMAAGAAYDLAFAIAILGFAVPAAALLGLELPRDRVYFGLNGVLLLLLAALYVLPAVEPRRYRGVVAVAAAGRLVGFVYLGAVWLGGAPNAFAVLAAGDLAFAVAHAGLLLAALRSKGGRSAQTQDSPTT